MSILITKAGILSTVQDLGRNGFRRFGINQNGAMDRTAVRLINILLGNSENTAVLELHFPAPEIAFEEPVVFALGGANFSAKLNGTAIENWRVYFAEKGSTLKFNEKIFGNRAYLSVRGGFQIKSWLGSASTNLKAKIGGFEGRMLGSGDRIFFEPAQNFKDSNFNFRISDSMIPRYSRFPTARVVEGAEFENLTAFSQQNLLKETFAITANSDRMGFRLRGEALFLLDEKELISSAVSFGTIQLLPDGQMIVLMADHQTSGGYPRIAHVAPFDLPLLAQLGANDKVGFHLISIAEAENLLVNFENNLNLLRTACKFRF
jgi:antagonist of KipI